MLYKLIKYQNSRFRCWVELRASVLLTLEPFVIASIATGIWYLFWSHGIHFEREETEVLVADVRGVLVMLFAVPAGLVFLTNWEHTQKVRRYAEERNKHEFMMNRDNVVPTIMHVALAGLGLPPLILIMASGFPTFLSGLIMVFSTWFAFSLYFIVTLELQNPLTSTWFKTQVDPDWKTQDIGEYLKLKSIEKFRGEKPQPETLDECSARQRAS